MYILGSQQNAWTPDHNLSNDTNAALLEYGLSLILPVQVKHCRKKKRSIKTLNPDFLSLVIFILY